MPEIPHQVLAKWAVGKPTIKALYVFGSYARGQARPDSDLDLAFEFINVDAPLSELIEKADVLEGRVVPTYRRRGQGCSLDHRPGRTRN